MTGVYGFGGAITHAISSVASATLAVGFSTTTLGSWVSTGLTITPATGNYVIVHVLVTASITAQNTLQFGIGAAPAVVSPLFNDAAVSISTNYTPFSFTQEFSAPDGVTARTVYVWQNATAGTAALRQGLATDPLNSANVATCRILGVVFN